MTTDGPSECEHSCASRSSSRPNPRVGRLVVFRCLAKDAVVSASVSAIDPDRTAPPGVYRSPGRSVCTAPACFGASLAIVRRERPQPGRVTHLVQTCRLARESGVLPTRQSTNWYCQGMRVARTLRAFVFRSTVTLKRSARVAGARLPLDTKARLLAATLKAHRVHSSNGKNMEVPLGAFSVTLASSTFYIDYCTAYGMLVDNLFDSDFQGAHVLDIGAHKGYYGAVALAGGAERVWSFEPSSQNYYYLERAAASATSADLGMQKWKTEKVAIADKHGEAALNLTEASWSHSLLQPGSEMVVATERVDVITLEDLIERVRLHAPRSRLIVKINVEGMAGTIVTCTPINLLSAISEVWIDLESNEPLSEDVISSHLERSGLALSMRSGNRRRYIREVAA